MRIFCPDYRLAKARTLTPFSDMPVFRGRVKVTSSWARRLSKMPDAIEALEMMQQKAGKTDL